MLIHLTWLPNPSIKQALEDSLLPTHQLSYEGTPPETTEILIDGRPSVETLKSLPSLHSLIIPFAGLPEVTRNTLLNFPGIKVFNIHHNADSTAEMAIGLMISAAKHLEPFSRSMKEGRWVLQDTPLTHTSLKGKQVVILGYGEIGKRVARVCRALDMQVSTLRRNQSAESPSGITSLNPEELNTALQSADILQVCLPMTRETEGLISREKLELLPPHAVVVNTARARVIDEEAFYEALRDRKIKAAGLDVWWDYPKDRKSETPSYPSRFPFHTLPNVIMTPHRGGDLGDLSLEMRRAEHLITSIKSIQAGSPRHQVDLLAGY